jgi:hypothetical protein
VRSTLWALDAATMQNLRLGSLALAGASSVRHLAYAARHSAESVDLALSTASTRVPGVRK